MVAMQLITLCVFHVVLGRRTVRSSERFHLRTAAAAGNEIDENAEIEPQQESYGPGNQNTELKDGKTVNCEVSLSTDQFLPEELLSEGVFLFCGDLSRGESGALQRVFQPLGQQSRTVSVQTQQHLREMLRQTARRAASDRLRPGREHIQGVNTRRSRYLPLLHLVFMLCPRSETCFTWSMVSVRSFPSLCNTSPRHGMSLQRGSSSVFQGRDRNSTNSRPDQLDSDIKDTGTTHYRLNLQRIDWQLLLWASLETWVIKSLEKTG